MRQGSAVGEFTAMLLAVSRNLCPTGLTACNNHIPLRPQKHPPTIHSGAVLLASITTSLSKPQKTSPTASTPVVPPLASLSTSQTHFLRLHLRSDATFLWRPQHIHTLKTSKKPSDFSLPLILHLPLSLATSTLTETSNMSPTASNLPQQTSKKSLLQPSLWKPR